MFSPEKRSLLALNNFSKFGPRRLQRLWDYFGSWEKAFTASSGNIVKAGVESRVADEFASWRNDYTVEKTIELLAKEKINLITLQDKNYPKRLRQIYDPPLLLYGLGDVKRDNYSISVVGTRKYTVYGESVVHRIVPDLARQGFTVVSGLALGIDTLAHLACLNSGGRTVAVLGTGIDRQSLYPARNRYLVDKIITAGGAVVSEFPPGTQPLKYNFPQRNRIIAGYSLGTLVIEAGERSGALITAHHALDQNREVFAIPGNINSPVSIGPNKLIKQGARTVTKANDILEELDLCEIKTHITAQKNLPSNREESIILDHLGHQPVHIDDLVRLTKLSVSRINSTLTVMEMKGMVKNIGQMQYILFK